MIHFNIAVDYIFHNLKISYWLVLAILVFSCGREAEKVIDPVSFQPAIGQRRAIQLDMLTEVKRGLTASNRISLFGHLSVMTKVEKEYQMLFVPDSFSLETRSPEGTVTVSSSDSLEGVSELSFLEDSLSFQISKDLSLHLPDAITGLEAHDFFLLKDERRIGQEWETVTLNGKDTLAHSLISYVSQDSVKTRLQTRGSIQMDGITLIGMSFKAEGMVYGWMIVENSSGWPLEMQLEWKGSVRLPFGDMSFRNSFYFKIM